MSRRKLGCAVLAAAVAWASGATAADIRLNNLDAGTGVGLDDPTPVAPVGGNPGRTRGEQARIVFEFAASLWGAVLKSRVPITVEATFKKLPCSANSAQLGFAGGTYQTYFNPEQVPPGAQANTMYLVALANALKGLDINQGQAEIHAEFNSGIGSPGCLDGDQWYFGLDGDAAGKRNFLHTLLHEFAHGLGFVEATNRSTGQLPTGMDGTVLGDIYAGNVYDYAQGKSWYAMTDAERLRAMTSDGNLVFAGAHVRAESPLALNQYRALVVTAPAAVAGEYGYGAVTRFTSFRGTVVRAATGANAEACAPLDNAAAVAGHVVMIDFGASCALDTKLGYAQSAGAVAAIIVDDREGQQAALSSASNMPVVAISKSSGAALAANSAGLSIETRNVLAGADSYGNVKLFAPRTYVNGTSFVHFDTSVSPYPVMMPYDQRIKAKDQLDLDLTPSVLQDEGWKVNAGGQLLRLCDTGVPTWRPGGVIVGANIGATAQLLARSSATLGDYVSGLRAHAAKLTGDRWLSAAQVSSLNACLSDAELAKQYASWRQGGDGGPRLAELDSGIAQSDLAGAAGSERLYLFTVLPGARVLNIRTFGGSGDVSLLVKAGNEPTSSSYDYRSVHAGNSESIVVSRPAPGEYLIKLVGAAAYANVSVQATAR